MGNGKRSVTAWAREVWRRMRQRKGRGRLAFELAAVQQYARDLNAHREVLKRRILTLEAAQEVPRLSPAEMERLAMLAEECGEVIQAVGKILRYGYESRSPYGGPTNRVALERELGDVRALVNMMLDAGDVRLGDIQTWQRRKKEKAAMWTHHQPDSTPREEQPGSGSGAGAR